MARRSKIEVSAINIRISSDKERNYSELLRLILQNKLAIKVYGNNFLAITHFDSTKNFGVLSKYSEIDIDGDWFDIEDFGPAAPEKIDEVVIPETLRPNLSAFYFELVEDLHIVTFEVYSDSKALSARSVEKFFREALNHKSVVKKYGRVEADVVKSFGEIDRIIALSNLKELQAIIRKPNPDDVSGDLVAEIEERLKDQNAEEYEETLRSKDKDGITPNERTKKLVYIAAENGEVRAKSIVNGVQIIHTTEEKPEKIVETYNKDKESSRSVFHRLAEKMAENIRLRRQAT